MQPSQHVSVVITPLCPPLRQGTAQCDAEHPQIQQSAGSKPSQISEEGRRRRSCCNMKVQRFEYKHLLHTNTCESKGGKEEFKWIGVRTISVVGVRLKNGDARRCQKHTQTSHKKNPRPHSTWIPCVRQSLQSVSAVCSANVVEQNLNPCPQYEFYSGHCVNKHPQIRTHNTSPRDARVVCRQGTGR